MLIIKIKKIKKKKRKEKSGILMYIKEPSSKLTVLFKKVNLLLTTITNLL